MEKRVNDISVKSNVTIQSDLQANIDNMRNHVINRYNHILDNMNYEGFKESEIKSIIELLMKEIDVFFDFVDNIKSSAAIADKYLSSSELEELISKICQCQSNFITDYTSQNIKNLEKQAYKK
ncbi:MAG: hypothetical protein LBF58_10770 [Deltaproteobacteria bacterium]|jgi:hypothetical protein|nr:hypothetical protein [Deltaproteobacteria bacterium]